MKMTEFRSQQPLGEDDFAAIRRNVMRTIAARERFLPLAMRFAIAAIVVIAIGAALIARFALRDGTPASPPAGLAASAPPLSQYLERRDGAQPAGETPALPVERVVVHRPHHRKPQIRIAQPNIRVEFRTSDPDVRIIWIASQTPSTTSGGKS